MRNVCQVGIGTTDCQRDEFGIEIPDSGETIICGKPAVDYYITDVGDKFWQCPIHWDFWAKACANVGADPHCD